MIASSLGTARMASQILNSPDVFNLGDNKYFRSHIFTIGIKFLAEKICPAIADTTIIIGDASILPPFVLARVCGKINGFSSRSALSIIGKIRPCAPASRSHLDIDLAGFR